jgi:hypothetical protein
MDGPLDDPLGLELLQPLGQQAVGDVGDEHADLREAQRPALEQDEQDGARPAPSDQLDRSVIESATGRSLTVRTGRYRRLLRQLDNRRHPRAHDLES